MNAEAAARLAQAVGGNGKASSAFRLGLVRVAGGGQLCIDCDGLALECDDLWVDPRLNFHWTVDHGEAEHLRTGERVLLLTLDGEDYYLIGKAVKA